MKMFRSTTSIRMYLSSLYFQAILLVFVSLSSADISSSPFCKVCECNSTTNEVLCTKEIKHYNIFNDTTYWFDSSANSSYDYKIIRIHHSGIGVVTPIPESPVQVLDLSNNRIQDIAEGSFKELQNMHTLILSNNQISSETLHKNTLKGKYLAGDYEPLRSLKVFKIDGNDIHTFNQDFFAHTSHLEELDIHGNPVTFLDINTQASFGNLLYLNYLDMSYMKLKEIPEHFFHTTRYIETLNLSGNLLTKVPTALRNAKNLKYLSLNDNSIVNVTEEEGFPQLPNLKVLHLSNSKELTRINKHSMCGLSGLEELYISDNPKLIHLDEEALSMRSDHVEQSSWPRSLKKLYLKNNKLSYLDYNFYPYWDSLEDIEIRDNPWACECETQWMADHLVKILHKFNKTQGLDCASPIEMVGLSIEMLSNESYTFRCLDMYDHRPEKDANILIGLLVGLLLAIPMVLGLYLCYKRNWFGYFERGPAAYSRKFYNRTSTNNDDMF